MLTAPGPDATIFALARRCHGVVARAELLRSGVPPHVIDRRVKQGRLEPLHPGVYRVGPLRDRHEREAAAVAACGATAALSHRTAAALWNLVPPPPRQRPVHVTVVGGALRVRGVRVHRSRTLHRRERTTLSSLPVTTPARTILDLAATTHLREVEQAFARADRQGLANRKEIERVLARHVRPRGATALRALLEQNRAPLLTRSEAEARFLDLVRKAGLPDPEANVRINGREADFLWRASRVAVEIDGFAYHRSRAAFEDDRTRDAALAAEGFRTLRFTWRRMVGEPRVVVDTLTRALFTWSAP